MRSTPQPAANPWIRWLPYLFAAGAVFWLVELTQSAAMAAAPVGRAQLEQTLVNSGITHDTSTVLVVYLATILGFQGAAAALHGAAYFGLRARRWWGWVVAIIVAGAWSLLLIGIPVLAFLLQRRTREAYGVL